METISRKKWKTSSQISKPKFENVALFAGVNSEWGPPLPGKIRNLIVVDPAPTTTIS